MSDENENNGTEENHEDIFNTDGDNGISEEDTPAPVIAPKEPSAEQLTLEAEQAEKANAIRAELESLKSRATTIGIKFHPSIGLDKLRAKVNAQLSKDAETVQREKQNSQVNAEIESNVDTIPDVPQGQFLSAPTKTVETKAQRNMRLRKKASALVRIRLTNMNPAKKNWKGEIFTVSNSSAGTHRKYVPFGAENGWHIPNIMLNMIRDRNYVSHFIAGKDNKGRPIKRHRLVKEFGIEVMPPLTLKEIQELKQQQAMADNIGKDY